jgi:hypothetical protein
MKKIFVRGPVLSATGYGEQSRFALRALRSRPDLFDVYIQPIPWGNSGWIWQDNEMRQWMDEKIKTTQTLLEQKKLSPDISLQITIPNEFEKMCPINIGYTAGIETTKVSPTWLQKGNDMDKIIVVSQHAKNSYVNTKIPLKDGKEYKLETPIDVVSESTPISDAEEIAGFNPENDFNFLVVSQFGPRKNFTNTIKWFVEKFHDTEVGLILKTHNKGASVIDLGIVEASLKVVLSEFPNRKCKVSLLHGDLTEGQMRGLYEHDKVKCLINIAHGEGYGLPLFEAARSGLPIATIPWSGQLDFLQIDGENFFNAVDCTLKPVQDEAVWDGVIQKDSMWAFADKDSYQNCLEHIMNNYEDCCEAALTLKEHIATNFSDDKLYAQFCDSVMGKSIKEPKQIEAISFCIPTNGKKVDETLLTINSIKKEMGDFPHEIIIAGDVDNFSNLEGVTLVDKKEEAHSRKVATLRNAGGDASKFDVIAWLDDDILLDKGWLEGAMNYSETKGWDVLGNKLLNPNGTRHWDRATLKPHRMVDYDTPEYTKTLYQTSGFIMVRKEVFEKVRWDDDCLVRGDQEGGMSEDVKFSLDLVSAGFNLSFNDGSTVWHNDDSYTQINNVCVKKELIEGKLDYRATKADEFEELLEDLK